MLIPVHWPPLAEVLSIANPGVSGWTTAVALSLVPLVAGQLSLLPRLRVRAPS